MSYEGQWCPRCNQRQTLLTELGLTRLVCRGCRLNEAVETQRMDRDKQTYGETLKDRTFE